MKPVILFCCLVFILSACQNEARWYPEAEVAVQSHTEYTNAAGRNLAVILTVHNTSSTSIASGTVTVKAVTDKREYLQTTGFTSKIVPDGKIALSVSITYLEPDEQAVPGGVALYNAFFD
jgi:hypothetical protein